MEESGEDEEEAFFSFLVRENDIAALGSGTLCQLYFGKIIHFLFHNIFNYLIK